MTLSTFQKAVLGLAGVTAFAIGAAILAAPLAFYASYGIALAADANLLSELRAPGAGLAAFGAIMLAGVWRAEWAATGVVAAMAVYLAFPLGRLVSLALDGAPSSSVLGALIVELALAGLCVVAFRRGGARPVAAPSDARAMG